MHLAISKLEYVIISAIMILFIVIMYILQKLIRLSGCYNQLQEDLSFLPTLIEFADMRLRAIFNITPSQTINPEDIEEEEEIEMPTRYIKLKIHTNLYVNMSFKNAPIFSKG